MTGAAAVRAALAQIVELLQADPADAAQLDAAVTAAAALLASGVECSAEGCDQLVSVKGLCRRHYDQNRNRDRRPGRAKPGPQRRRRPDRVTPSTPSEPAVAAPVSKPKGISNNAGMIEALKPLPSDGPTIAVHCYDHGTVAQGSWPSARSGLDNGALIRAVAQVETALHRGLTGCNRLCHTVVLGYGQAAA